MNERHIVLFGVPGAIEKIMQAKWLPYANLPQIEYFDGLMIRGDYLCDTPDAITPRFCTVCIENCVSHYFLVSGFVSERFKHSVEQPYFSVLGYRRLINRIDLDHKIVGQAEIREPFTLSYDSERRVRYRMSVTFP